jgi:plasmid stabilization system protein ParE
VGRHAVFYRVEPRRIVILRVLHPAQDPVTLRQLGPDT